MKGIISTRQDAQATLAGVLRAARLRAGLSAEELADRLGWPVSQVRRAEQRGDRLTLQAVRAWEEACGLRQDAALTAAASALVRLEERLPGSTAAMMRYVQEVAAALAHEPEQAEEHGLDQGQLENIADDPACGANDAPTIIQLAAVPPVYVFALGACCRWRREQGDGDEPEQEEE